MAITCASRRDFRGGRWTIFQALTLAVAGVLLVIAVPLYFAVLRPERESDLSICSVNSTLNELGWNISRDAVELLPPIDDCGTDPSKRAQVGRQRN
jgi:hypothetical protein